MMKEEEKEGRAMRHYCRWIFARKSLLPELLVSQQQKTRLGFVNQAPPQPPRDGRTAARSILISILRCTSTSAIGRRHEARKL
ncbi:hypothetical protein CEP53_009939 [Fusarium sp. AF-6]|nr:hypothetical protein CEP53_009939 [Fusarium sp. AF-6]